jgi:hypothetical protein
MTTSVCERCHQKRVDILVSAGSATLEGMTVDIEPRRSSVCPRCDADGAEDDARTLPRLLADLDAAIHVARRGLTRLERCGACGALLDMPRRSTVRSITVLSEPSAPFTTTMTLTLTRCPDCALDNLSPRDRRHLRRAATMAFRASVRRASTA